MKTPIVVIAIFAAAAGASVAQAERALPEYRYFRSLSLDLLGRPPSRAELAAFARPGFELDAWLDAQLKGPAYTERIRRIYADLLRLDLPEGANPFRPPSIMLRQTTIMDPDGKTIDLYFRENQRR